MISSTITIFFKISFNQTEKTNSQKQKTARINAFRRAPFDGAHWDIEDAVAMLNSKD